MNQAKVDLVAFLAVVFVAVIIGIFVINMTISTSNTMLIEITKTPVPYCLPLK